MTSRTNLLRLRSWSPLDLEGLYPFPYSYLLAVKILGFPTRRNDEHLSIQPRPPVNGEDHAPWGNDTDTVGGTCTVYRIRGMQYHLSPNRFAHLLHLAYALRSTASLRIGKLHLSDISYRPSFPPSSGVRILRMGRDNFQFHTRQNADSAVQVLLNHPKTKLLHLIDPGDASGVGSHEPSHGCRFAYSFPRRCRRHA